MTHSQSAPRLSAAGHCDDSTDDVVDLRDVLLSVSRGHVGFRGKIGKHPLVLSISENVITDIGARILCCISKASFGPYQCARLSRYDAAI